MSERCIIAIAVTDLLSDLAKPGARRPAPHWELLARAVGGGAALRLAGFS